MADDVPTQSAYSDRELDPAYAQFGQLTEKHLLHAIWKDLRFLKNVVIAWLIVSVLVGAVLAWLIYDAGRDTSPF